MACYIQSKKGVRSPHFGCLFSKNKWLSADLGVRGMHQKEKGAVTGFVIKGNGERSASLHTG